MNRQFEKRLKRLEQKQSQGIEAKKAWVPQWLSDIWSEDYGLPFDTEERGLDSIRRIQKLEKVVMPALDGAPPIARDSQVATWDELERELDDGFLDT